jgi:DNA repair exonuclease SbcCD nuclease subunit
MQWTLVADPQFDDQLNYSTICDDGLSSRLHNYIDCFDRIVADSVEKGSKGILLLGDIFDSRTAVSLSVIDQVCRSFQRAKDLGLELHVLVGNHDSQLRVPRVNSLQAFLGLAHVWESPSVYQKFAFMPWIEDEDAFRAGVKELADNPQPDFLFSHALFEGAVPKVAGRAISDLIPERWKQVVLGDVHGPIKIAPNVRYCGAPMQIHYGDAGRDRGYYFLDDETGDLEYVVNTWSPRFHIVKDTSFLGKLDGFSPMQVGRADFVRIKVDDAKEAMRLAQTLSHHTDWVESLAVEEPDNAPRIQVSVRDSHTEAIEMYLKYQNLDAVDGLLETALSIMEESN